jgi:hypothetical protein
MQRLTTSWAILPPHALSSTGPAWTLLHHQMVLHIHSHIYGRSLGLNPVTALLLTINSALSAYVCMCGGGVRGATSSGCFVQEILGTFTNVINCSVTVLDIRGLPTDDLRHKVMCLVRWDAQIARFRYHQLLRLSVPVWTAVVAKLLAIIVYIQNDSNVMLLTV